MININTIIYDALKALEGVSQVCKEYPHDFGAMPCITYRVEDNSASVTVGGSEKISSIRFQVDVWSKTASEGSALLDLVNATFGAMGFERVFSAGLEDPATGLSHTVAKFGGLVDLRTNYIKQ